MSSSETMTVGPDKQQYTVSDSDMSSAGQDSLDDGLDDLNLDALALSELGLGDPANIYAAQPLPGWGRGTLPWRGRPWGTCCPMHGRMGCGNLPRRLPGGRPVAGDWFGVRRLVARQRGRGHQGLRGPGVIRCERWRSGASHD